MSAKPKRGKYFIFILYFIFVEDIKNKIIEILFQGEITQRELRERLGISKSYLSEILKSMEDKGTIIRKKITKRTIVVGLNKKKFLRIGILKASEYAAVFLSSKEIKEFSVHIIIYNNSLEEMRDLLTEKIDIAFAPAITGLIFHMVDNDVVMISACSRGGSGVIYRDERIDYLGSTFLSTMDIISRQFSDKKVRIKYFSSPEEILNSYYRGDVQAISIWEPYFSIVEEGKKIQFSKDIICCGLITLKKNIDERILKFNEVFNYESNNLREGKNREEASKMISQRLNIDYEIILKSLDSYIFETKIDEEDIKKITNIIGMNLNEEVILRFINRQQNSL
ncbi:MAG: winged helix-turn-helix transcriptional regulator [Euryarchaeota archaeon]|nr:winged helix-turn-helix transcriptional regulator [Euryarchaeota archaeon]MVT35955.1 winged helix-turn-helix transcriptional regulator [Euryarchaeota archaeon]